MGTNSHLTTKDILLKSQPVQRKESIDFNQMIAPCGLPCFECDMYLANENQEFRETIAEEWGIPIEQATCKGCRNENGKCGHLPIACHVYPCTQKKGIEFCSDCSDFPCDHLHPYGDMADKIWHNTKVFNLCLIKKMGLESWARNKAGTVRDTYCFADWTL